MINLFNLEQPNSYRQTRRDSNKSVRGRSTIYSITVNQLCHKPSISQSSQQSRKRSSLQAQCSQTNNKTKKSARFYHKSASSSVPTSVFLFSLFRSDKKAFCTSTQHSLHSLEICRKMMEESLMMRLTFRIKSNIRLLHLPLVSPPISLLALPFSLPLQPLQLKI